ncbi:hypothetical protein [Pollutimonas thiosulfatoxidans]|uniref:Uncharacterized protein n=1 Tax=Pollutimonas thiosulfatoxidans TaxID=2028345 RepID=A0A410GDM4_9BURK|nr:hypothetical protein [Pollutimonas thiosulfatoxidans]QAA94402.1 hypothetical protein CKA81_11575 [Pollutimonas thiosulfatoxidans]
MTEPAPVARYRAALAELDPRISIAAQLRALFPLIEAELTAGVPHAAVLDDLAAAGLSVQYSTYAITLYRWRKAQRSAAAKPASQPKPHAAPATPPKAPPTSAPALDAIQGRPSNIETPGDLRKIRDMRIDLEALRREGK